MSSKQVTISIVTYNSADTIVDCLHSLKAQTFQDFNLIIVDNGSTDNTCTLITKNYPEACMISMTYNSGYGGGHNLSIGLSDTPWVLLLNTDITLEHDALEQLMTATDDNSRAAIGPLLYRNKEKALIDAAGLERTFYWQVSDRGQNKEPNKELLQAQTVWGLTGACVLYRREALESVQYDHADRAYDEYLDEDFFMYKEDVDLAARLNRKGWTSYYYPKAIGYHERSWKGRPPVYQIHRLVKSRASTSAYLQYCSYRNHFYLLLKNASAASIIPILGYEFLKFCYIALFQTASIIALIEVIKYLPRMLKKRYV